MPQANPVLVEITRGASVESIHRGAYVAIGPGGAVVEAAGDVARAVFPRSAIKVLQALPLVESGAADDAGFTDADLALAISSHSGEPMHASRARGMLSRLGLGEDALACSPHWPQRMEDQAALHRAGEEPCRLHNNCSGKHAGMLALAAALGAPPAGYEKAEHPVQQAVHAVMEAMTGAAHEAGNCGIDGCAIPTYAVPLEALARAFARIATGEGMDEARAAAVTRLRRAAAAHPELVAGTGRFCTRVMRAFGEAAFVKTGAEGVFCAALPGRGLGIALKIDDGATRASEAVMAALLRRHLAPSGEAADVLASFADKPIVTWGGVPVGATRVILPDGR